MASVITKSRKPPVGIHINVLSSKLTIPGLQALLAKGISVRTRKGGTLDDLLCGQLGIHPDYLKNRIQTLFLNNNPVDDVGKAVLANGDVVALSAAMPGLAGATLRKGGFYAQLRDGISHQTKGVRETEPHTGRVTVRLFNVIAYELGPALMENGVIVDGKALLSFLKMAAPVLTSPACALIVDGEVTSIPVLLGRNLSGQTVRLTLQTVAGGRG